MDCPQKEENFAGSSNPDNSIHSNATSIDCTSERNESEIKLDKNVSISEDGLSTLPKQTSLGFSSSECAINSATASVNREPEDTEKKPENRNSQSADKDLEDLLDSALEDFDKHNTSNPLSRDTGQADTPKVAAAEVPNNNSTGKEALEALQFLAPNDGGESTKDPFSDMFTEQVSDEMAKAFEEAMKGLLSEDPNLKEQLDKLTMSAGDSMDTPEAQKEFTDTLSQTLAGLAKNVEDLQGLPDEDVAKMFGNMNMGDGAEGGDFMPMMQGMMKTLMSKDVLYPSLKELSEKYPKWLTDNKDKLDETDYKKYQSQEQTINRICHQFEHDDSSDTDEKKQKRFEETMVLMQEMQELGQPPKEIVNEMAPGLEFDENGLPKMPGMGSGQCAIM